MRRPADFLRQRSEELLGQSHQVAVIAISLIELEHGELGIVLGGDPFIAEIAVDLVHAVEPADHQSLQIKLRGNAQVEVEIEGIVMGDERARGGAAGDGLHHGRFHFDVAARIEEVAQARAGFQRGGRTSRGRAGSRSDPRSAGGSAIATSARPCHFSGSGSKALESNASCLHPDRQFIGLGAKQIPRNAHDVAHIQQLEQMEDAFANHIELDVDLQAAAVSLNMGEARLAVKAKRQNAPGRADVDALGLEGRGIAAPVGGLKLEPGLRSARTCAGKDRRRAL